VRRTSKVRYIFGTARAAYSGRDKWSRRLASQQVLQLDWEGGAGFLGSRVVEKLRQCRCEDIFVPRSKEFDLRKMEDIARLFELSRPSMVIHLAATVGGIGANQKNPARFFYENAIMGIQILEYAAHSKVEKFVCIGTVCSYPKFTPVPFEGKIPLGWLSRGNQCALWTCQEDASRPMSGISAAVWI
jgi:nucleoside-diphosphate-sugar epimerase